VSSSNTRIWLVVLIGAGLGAGGLYAGKSLLSSSKNDVTLGQAKAWGEMWRHARFCLAGPNPYAANGALVIELREALSQKPRAIYQRCLRLVERTERPRGPAAHDPRVEKQWTDLLSATDNLAAALRIRLNSDSEERTRRLGEAVQQVDEVHARLRRELGLNVNRRTGSDQLEVLKPLVLRGNTASVRTHKRLRQWGDRLLAETYDPKRRLERLYTIRGPDQVASVERVFAKNQSVPGVWVDKKEQFALKVKDSRGTVRTLATTTDEPTPVFAMSDKASRIVAWSTTAGLHLAETSDGGKTWTTTDVGPRWAAKHLGWSRVDLLNTGPDGSLAFTTIDLEPTTLRPRPSLRIAAKGPADKTTACYGKTATWWRITNDTGTASIAHTVAGATRAVTSAPGIKTTTGCDDTALVGIGGDVEVLGHSVTARKDQSIPVFVCADGACRRRFSAPVAGGAHLAAVRSPKGVLVVAAHAKRILSVWRDGVRTIYRLNSTAKLDRLAVFGDRVYAVLFGDDKLRLAPLP